MIPRYRNYTFATGLSTFEIDPTNVFNEFYQRESTQYSIRIKGELRVPNTTADADNAATLIALEQELAAAFAVDGGDFRVTYPTGEEYLMLRSADFISGLRVVRGPSFIENNPGELVRRRSFQIELAGEKFVGDPNGGGGGGGAVEVSRTERISYQGTGGPRIVVTEVMEGDPDVQQTNERTACRCTQVGRIVQRYSPPSAPPPLYPEWLVNDQAAIEPSLISRDTYEIAWNYNFVSPRPFPRT